MAKGGEKDQKRQQHSAAQHSTAQSIKHTAAVFMFVMPAAVTY